MLWIRMFFLLQHQTIDKIEVPNFLLRIIFIQSAMFKAVQKINHQANRKPKSEPKPVVVAHSGQKIKA